MFYSSLCNQSDKLDSGWIRSLRNSYVLLRNHSNNFKHNWLHINNISKIQVKVECTKNYCVRTIYAYVEVWLTFRTCLQMVRNLTFKLTVRLKLIKYSIITRDVMNLDSYEHRCSGGLTNNIGILSRVIELINSS